MIQHVLCLFRAECVQCITDDGIFKTTHFDAEIIKHRLEDMSFIHSGLKVAFKGGPIRATLGVFDGNGTVNRGFIGVDNDTEKDFFGRVAVDFKWFSAGVSGSGGLTYKQFGFLAARKIHRQGTALFESGKPSGRRARGTPPA